MTLRHHLPSIHDTFGSFADERVVPLGAAGAGVVEERHGEHCVLSVILSITYSWRLRVTMSRIEDPERFVVGLLTDKWSLIDLDTNRISTILAKLTQLIQVDRLECH